MFNDFEMLRNEINYFLFIIESSLGSKYRTYAEEALVYIFYCFFFNKQDIELYNTIDRLEIYMTTIYKECKEISPVFKENIPLILRMIKMLKQEM